MWVDDCWAAHEGNMDIVWKNPFPLGEETIGYKVYICIYQLHMHSKSNTAWVGSTVDFDVSDSLHGICLMGNICEFFSCKINECKAAVIECKIPLIVALLWRYVTKWQVF